MRAVAILVLMLVVYPSQALPIKWTVENAILTGSGPAPFPGSVVGSFFYDADTNTYSELFFLVTLPITTGGIGFVATHQNDLLPATSRRVLASGGPGAESTPFLSLSFVSPLTNAGGIVGLRGGVGGCEPRSCVNPTRLFPGSSIRDGATLRATVPVAVSVPSSAWLLVISLITGLRLTRSANGRKQTNCMG